MDRILLITGDMVRSEEPLRRRVLRFTGSRKATRIIMNRIDTAQRLGQVMSCMVVPGRVPSDSEDGADRGWDVRVSYATAGAPGGHDA